MKIVYCHFKTDEAVSKRRTELFRVLGDEPSDALSEFEWRSVEIFLEDEFLRSTPSLCAPRIWIWHATQFPNNDYVKVLRAIKWEGMTKKNLFIILASGEALPMNDEISKAIKYAKDANFGGLAYLPIDLDAEDKKALNSTLERIRSRFGDGKIPDFGEFEQSFHPPSKCWFQACIEQLVATAAFDKARHGRFAEKLLERLSIGETMVGVLEINESQALAEFITHLAEFERCRSSLSHMTLNNLRQSLRLTYETVTNPNDFPFQNDRECVRRLMAYVHQDGLESIMYRDSTIMIEKADLILQSTSIQDVVCKLQETRTDSSGIRKSGFDANSLERVKACWNELRTALNAFPKYDGKNDEAWLTEIQTTSLESARIFAEAYQGALARKNFYEEMQ